MGIKGKKIEEFEKANIILRTVRLKYNGVPAEAVSFSAFDYNEIIQEEWETSTLKTEYLDKKICFVIYQYTTMDKEDSKLYLKDVLFWALPFKHIDAAKSTWEETIKRIKMGRSDKLPTAKETKVIHVRPHAQKKKDACKTPTGGMETKKSFWINAKYLAKEFEKILSSFKHDKTLERLNQ